MLLMLHNYSLSRKLIISIFLWRTKVSEAVCKREWRVNEVIFIFLCAKISDQNLDEVCNGLYT